jgi:hypothetical protein
MKKILLLCGSTFLLFLFSDCTKEELSNSAYKEKLIAVWYKSTVIEDENQTSKQEYHFNDDNTFEILRKIIDDTTGDILGYRFRQTGVFEVDSTQLTFNTSAIYTNDEEQGRYNNIEDLVFLPQSAPASNSVSIEFADNYNTLIIYPPCPPLACCIGSLTLQKE